MNNDELRTALKAAASALKDSEVPFALGGSYALWVHGAPEPTHDVDLVVTDDDADRAAEILGGAGFEIERPPEDWLVKAARGDAVVDVLHRLNGVPVDAALLARAKEQDVLGVRIPVQTAHDVMRVKLLALTEHYCDLGAILPSARAVREQVDWAQLRSDCAENDFAAVFILLAERLGIA
jgi:predicted nucleotidyltransferase